MDNFDTEIFISEIENRPAIWDNSSAEYSNRDLKKRCWEEIVDIFGGRELSILEKKDLGLDLQKKWQSLRTCFARELRNQRTIKPGQSAKKRRIYMYYDNLLFLLPSIENRESKMTDKGSDDDSDDENRTEAEGTSTPTEYNRMMSEEFRRPRKKTFEESLLELLKSKKKEEDGDVNFVLSIVPTLKSLNELQKMEAKIEILTLLKSMKWNSGPTAQPSRQIIPEAATAQPVFENIPPQPSTSKQIISSFQRSRALISPPKPSTSYFNYETKRSSWVRTFSTVPDTIASNSDTTEAGPSGEGKVAPVEEKVAPCKGKVVPRAKTESCFPTPAEIIQLNGASGHKMPFNTITRTSVGKAQLTEDLGSVGPQASVSKPAPYWEGTAVVNGEMKELKLTDFKGKYLVFFFYPLDFTFVCPTEILAFNDRIEEFRKLDTAVVACSVDSHFTHLAWMNTPRKDGGLGKLEIPLLSDLTRTISRDYGVYLENLGHTLRGLFIIDQRGVVRQITMNDLPVGRSVDETLRLVQAFKYTDSHGEVCPAGWKPGQDTIIPDPEEKKKFFQRQNKGPEL